MPGRALMVQGCSSDVGKSYLTAALCRIYARLGVRVAPFKAQNMSNNAGVTPDGLEMGRAQLTQALAARVTPDVRMNPVLIKPEGDARSQVVVLGRRDEAVSRLPWTDRKAALWPVVQASLHSLLAEFELVVIEGAGSPAEVNLKAGDIVNMRVAREAEARVLLVADIDRGGAFAHLLGTWGCLDDLERETLSGFILNKFRGDPALLGDGAAWLEKRTGVPTLGVVPHLPLVLPEEDAFGLETDAPGGGAGGRLEVAVVKFPTVSNFDEFGALACEPDVSLRWTDTSAELANAGLIILPGSKHVAADGAWLGRTGLASEIQKQARAGVPILGVCGGLQLLGRRIDDPHGVESVGTFAGLGLLELDTILEPEKTTRITQTTLLPTGAAVSGYEIHHGRSHAWGETKAYLSGGLGFRRGNVTGVYLHGLFENTAFRTDYLGALGARSRSGDWAAQLDGTLDALADHVAASVELDKIDDAVSRGRVPRQASPRLILVTGGVRSGKSRYAEALAAHLLEQGEGVLYLATLTAGDDEMVRRIARHRARRPASWRTLETPLEPATALREASETVVLLDCLSGFVSNVLLQREADGEEAVLKAVMKGVDDLISAAQAAPKTLIIVTNEVGSGVVPAYPLGRRYRDALGLANARVAAAADAAALCVVGLPQLLKGNLPEVLHD